MSRSGRVRYDQVEMIGALVWMVLTGVLLMVLLGPTVGAAVTAGVVVVLVAGASARGQRG